jgi:tyrosine-protein kinase
VRLDVLGEVGDEEGEAALAAREVPAEADDVQNPQSRRRLPFSRVAVADRSAGAELRGYFGVLRRRKVFITLFVVGVTAAAVVVSLLQPDRYRASTAVLLPAADTGTLLGVTTEADEVQEVRLQTASDLLQSNRIEREVEASLGPVPDVSVETRTHSNLLTVSAEDEDPDRAADIANAYANAYVDFTRQDALDRIADAREEVVARADQLRAEIARLDLAPASDRNASRHQALVDQLEPLRRRLDELRIASALDTLGAEVVAPAEPPTEPTRAGLARNVVVALSFALVIGVGLAFLLELLDDSIRTAEDVETVISVPVVSIPTVPAWRKDRSPLPAESTDPFSPEAEGYHRLRTLLRPTGGDRARLVIEVTSPATAEGKTTTVANLGMALARAGERVALVSADMRRPRLHEFFELPNTSGLTTLASGSATLPDVTQRVEPESLVVVSSGPTPTNPSELLAGSWLDAAVAELPADVVVVDSPPLLPVADGTVLARVVDTTLLVVASGQTSRRDLRRAVALLEQIGAPLAAVVLNRAEVDEPYSHGYRPDSSDGSVAPGVGTSGNSPREAQRSTSSRP